MSCVSLSPLAQVRQPLELRAAAWPATCVCRCLDQRRSVLGELMQLVGHSWPRAQVEHPSQSDPTLAAPELPPWQRRSYPLGSVRTTPLAAPELYSCVTSGRAWRHWAARGEAAPLGAPATASGARASHLQSRRCHILRPSQAVLGQGHDSSHSHPTDEAANGQRWGQVHHYWGQGLAVHTDIGGGASSEEKGREEGREDAEAELVLEIEIFGDAHQFHLRQLGQQLWPGVGFGSSRAAVEADIGGPAARPKWPGSWLAARCLRGHLPPQSPLHLLAARHPRREDAKERRGSMASALVLAQSRRCHGL